MTSFVNVAQGVMNPGQVAQSINTAQQGIREQTDWGNAQLLKNIYSSSLNSDGSLRQSEFLSKAAKAGVGPAGVKSWLDTQNATNEAAKTQTMNNAIQMLYGLKPQALRDQNQLPEARQQAASQFVPKATTGIKATQGVGEADKGKEESQTSDTQSEGLLGKIVSGVKGLFSEPEATKASYSYLTPTEKYESDKPLEEHAGIVGNVVTDARNVVGYDDNFNPIYDNSGYKTDNQGMLTQNSSGMLGSNVGIAQDPNALNQGGKFTAVAPSADNGIRPPQPAPQVAPQQPMQAPDNRSILERLADSGTGMPQKASDAQVGGLKIENPIQYSQLNPNVQKMIATQMMRTGILKTGATAEDAQAALNADLERHVAAKAGPEPTPMQFMKDGTLDIGGYTTAYRAWMQNRQAAVKEYTDAVGKLWGATQTQDIAQAGNTRAEIAQNQQTTLYNQDQAVIKDAQNAGYKRVKNGAQAKEALAASQEVNRLDTIVHDANQLAAEIATGKLTREESASRWEVVKNGLASIDGATTGEMRNAIGADPILRANKSIGELIHGSENLKDWALRTTINDLSSLSDREYARLIQVMVKQANESSKARALDNYWRGIEIKKEKTGADAMAPSGVHAGTRQDPIPYTRGMATKKGKFYNVGGMVVEGKN